jgi:hypothetical protein
MFRLHSVLTGHTAAELACRNLRDDPNVCVSKRENRQEGKRDQTSPRPQHATRSCTNIGSFDLRAIVEIAPRQCSDRLFAHCDPMNFFYG